MWLLTGVWWALQSDKTVGWEKKAWWAREKYYCRLAYSTELLTLKKKTKNLYPWNGYTNSGCSVHTILATEHCNKMTSNSRDWFTYRQICLISKVNKNENVFRKTSVTCCTITLSPLVNARTLCKIREQIVFVLLLSGKNISFQNHVAYKLFNSSMHKQFMSFLTFEKFRGSAAFVERKRTCSHFASVLKRNNIFFGAGGWVIGDDNKKSHFSKFYLQE